MLSKSSTADPQCVSIVRKFPKVSCGLGASRGDQKREGEQANKFRFKLSKADLRVLVERYCPEGVPEAKQIDEKPRVLEMAERIAEAEHDDSNV
jgi:hypothetical protein